jgi:hypothetical protein
MASRRTKLTSRRWKRPCPRPLSHWSRRTRPFRARAHRSTLPTTLRARHSHFLTTLRFRPFPLPTTWSSPSATCSARCKSFMPNGRDHRARASRRLLARLPNRRRLHWLRRRLRLPSHEPRPLPSPSRSESLSPRLRPCGRRFSRARIPWPPRRSGRRAPSPSRSRQLVPAPRRRFPRSLSCRPRAPRLSLLVVSAPHPAAR